MSECTCTCSEAGAHPSTREAAAAGVLFLTHPRLASHPRKDAAGIISSIMSRELLVVHQLIMHCAPVHLFITMNLNILQHICLMLLLHIMQKRLCS